MKVVMMKGRYPRIYNQFSGGERSRIDMSILLSFFNTSRIISNWSCNIIFIDELIDNGVDQSGIDQFLSTLYNIVNENKKNKLGIYIVSHKLTEPKIAISSVIKIDKKPGGFSTLEVK
jgi:ABC-type Mn2+/Zn2+ transport system ATPase subunit